MSCKCDICEAPCRWTYACGGCERSVCEDCRKPVWQGNVCTSKCSVCVVGADIRRCTGQSAASIDVMCPDECACVFCLWCESVLAEDPTIRSKGAQRRHDRRMVQRSKGYMYKRVLPLNWDKCIHGVNTSWRPCLECNALAIADMG